MIFYEDPEEQKGSLKVRVFRNIMLGWAMFIALFGVGVVSLLILFPPGEAIYRSITGDSCESGTTHNSAIDVGDATVLRIAGDRGDLSVEGRNGPAAVQIEGRPCASRVSKRHLDSIVLNTSRNGDEIIVTVDMPRGVDDIRMDVRIFVPNNLPRVEITNSDGPVFVSNVRELQAAIGYGSLDAMRIDGNVSVLELEGSMSLIDIEGDVAVESIRGYGQVDLTGIGGSVVIAENESGPARISDVLGNVTIGSAGFGHLNVMNVAGNLSVQENPGGHITLDGVIGSVRIPGSEERPDT